ncbi:3-hydroxyisobutyrate dehydrogenase [Hahella sp. SMD15-11]|uniref:3-hydroxyisobutyrate dehydrogenase n=1 Tax=Thermohahella caldifontis TaxID=3142973 RepID=A0AB39USI4_9GAMM
MKTIAFIGLGHMGLPMARNLLRAGYDMRVFDLNPEPVGALAAEGAQAATSTVDAAEGADAVITMLPASAHSEAVYLGVDGLIARLRARPLLIDCSTIAAASARRIADAARQAGFAMLDAPVSGGTAGAEAGTLTFMVEGGEDDLERARPLFDVMGSRAILAGGPGAGQVAKMCNNMLLAIHMIGTAEALNLGVQHGLDPVVLSDIMRTSSGGNWSLEKYNPWPGVMDNVPSAREYEGGFASALMNKDLGLAMEGALETGCSTPLGALAKQLYQMHCDQGEAMKDFSSVVRLISGGQT